ncbi:MAG: DUF2227 family putative metal-binding protein [Euryarchaeota archaeon]|nr:DUF2227 family putative metal-binding protein [Euryarchaeota archaeon]
MPSDKIHTKINLLMLVIILTIMFMVGLKDVQLVTIFVLTYLFATYFLSPDLDIDSTPYKRWGVFRVLWYPYKTLIKHGGISHHPIAGPISILLNLFIILLPLLVFAKVILGIQSISTEIVGVIIIGCLLPIEIHIITDKIL